MLLSRGSAVWCLIGKANHRAGFNSEKHLIVHSYGAMGCLLEVFFSSLFVLQWNWIILQCSGGILLLYPVFSWWWISMTAISAVLILCVKNHQNSLSLIKIHSDQDIDKWLYAWFHMWCNHSSMPIINTLRPRLNGRHFVDDVLKCIFLNENVWILLKISLEFVPKGPINNIPSLVQVMAWRRPGDKPLSEPMMVSLLTHICVARSQWVNNGLTKLPLKLGYGWVIISQCFTYV